jgi:NitT/TauT family transport system substrate-binding protein
MTRRAMTVLMPFHTPFYTPLSAGVSLGHFADENLDVTMMPAERFGKGTIQALLDGDIEISLGGLMRSFDLADRGGPIVVHFAEVCSRNGFFLSSREPRPGFTWQDLVGKTVISFAEAPTPWQCMLTVLKKHGVDPARVRIERERPAPEAIAAFTGGDGDFLEQTQPTTERLVASGAAHVVASMGEATGPVPFTSYMTTPAFRAREPEVVLRFTRAVYRTQRWLAGASTDDIARAIEPHFPEIDLALRARIVERYTRQATWSLDPLLRRPGYDYLEQILLDGGFIAHRHRYEDLVDTELARQVMSDPGA